MTIKRKMVQCATAVNKKAVRRETIDGVEFIIVSSYTLPDNVVMNGGLYPADEIEKSFDSLERTLAPVEHPTDPAGNFISASDPVAIHDFHAGAYNENVTRENGRVHIEKRINVQEAMKTDRGKRLLDRIEELETNEKPRPIHTSVGVFLIIEDLDEPKTNEAGDEYTWVARDMVFDHDAILLDSTGAATPEQGVGMAVNSEGEKVEVDQVVLNEVKASKRLPLASSDREWDASEAIQRVRAAVGAEDEPNAAYARAHLWFDADNAENFGAYKLPFVDVIDGELHAVPAALRNAAARLGQTDGPTEAEREEIREIIDNYLEELRGNAEGMSQSQLFEQLNIAIRGIIAADWMYVVDVFEDTVIFETNSGFFEVAYRVDDGTATIVGIPLAVERVVDYVPKTNQKGDVMFKEMVLNALKEAGIETDGLSDDQLLDKYNQLQANSSEGDGEGAGNNADDVAAAVASAVDPLAKEIEGLKATINANADKEHAELAKIVGNSDKFPGLDEEAAAMLPADKLKEMAANCKAAHGIPFNVNSGGSDDQFSAPTDMPE